MSKYSTLIQESYQGYFNYLLYEIVTPTWSNYFYGLIAISLIVWVLELLFPWRKNQPILRKDFWLDLFYLFFNFFLLNLILLIALSNLSAQLLNDFFAFFKIGIYNFQLFSIAKLPRFWSLFLFFLISDFIQWNIHRLLHALPFLWKIHQTHHSVKQMGFAAHFRYNWMEPIVYKSILYLPIIIIGGFDLKDVFVVHFITIAIGHLNHANLGWDYGVLKYLINNPKMHIWHHSKKIPNKYGVNFGITLSLWDYIFKTNYIPSDGKDIELGFENDQTFPVHFIEQEIQPFKD